MLKIITKAAIITSLTKIQTKIMTSLIKIITIIRIIYLQTIQIIAIIYSTIAIRITICSTRMVKTTIFSIIIATWITKTTISLAIKTAIKIIYFSKAIIINSNSKTKIQIIFLRIITTKIRIICLITRTQIIYSIIISNKCSKTTCSITIKAITYSITNKAWIITVYSTIITIYLLIKTLKIKMLTTFPITTKWWITISFLTIITRRIAIACLITTQTQICFFKIII